MLWSRRRLRPPVTLLQLADGDVVFGVEVLAPFLLRGPVFGIVAPRSFVLGTIERHQGDTLAVIGHELLELDEAGESLGPFVELVRQGEVAVGHVVAKSRPEHGDALLVHACECRTMGRARTAQYGDR